MPAVGRPRRYATNAARQRAYRVRKTTATQQHKKVWLRNLTDRWGTPLAVFAPVQREFGITLDVCAEPMNAKTPRYFSPAENGLLQDWSQAVCWMNPPFSQVERWLQKALASARAGATVICLVKHTPGVGWWRKHIPPEAEIRALGRVRFVDVNGVQATQSATFDSALVILRPCVPERTEAAD